MSRKLIIGSIVLALLTVASGLIYGNLTNRWGSPELLEDSGELLKDIPHASFGDWEFVKSMEISESAKTTLECTGEFTGVYLNRRTGQSIRLFTIVGPFGPTAVHTPDVCYSGRAYRTTKDRNRRSVTLTNGQKHTFWTTTISSRNELDPHKLAVWYAWSADGVWVAPKYHRFAFMGKPRLYKLQLAMRLADDQEDGDEDISGFLEGFLPLLSKQVLVKETN